MSVKKDLKMISRKYHNFDKGMLNFVDDNTASVQLDGKNMEAIVHDYSLDVLPVADVNFIEYAKQRASVVPIKYQIEMDISFEEKLMPEQEQKVDEVVKRAFAEEAVLLKREARRNAIAAFMFLLAGIGSFVAYWYLANVATEGVFIVAEVFLIFSWAMIWETAEIFFIRRSKNLRRLYEVIRLWNAKIKISTYKKVKK